MVRAGWRAPSLPPLVKGELVPPGQMLIYFYEYNLSLLSARHYVPESVFARFKGSSFLDAPLPVCPNPPHQPSCIRRVWFYSLFHFNPKKSPKRFGFLTITTSGYSYHFCAVWLIVNKFFSKGWMYNLFGSFNLRRNITFNTASSSLSMIVWNTVIQPRNK